MKLINIFRSLNKEISILLSSFSRQKLKIGIISYYYEPPTISGVGVHTRFLAKSLSKNNCEVHIFCDNTDFASYRDGNVIVHNIGRTQSNVNSSSSKIRLNYFLFEAEVVKAVIRENAKREFDIIHTQGSLTKAAFILKKVCGIKWVHTFHAIEKSRIKKMSKEEKHFEDLISWIESNVNHCNGAIYVSSSLLKQGRKSYNIKSDIVIPNGVDTDLFRYAPITKKNVLFIGRFSKEKGIDLLPDITEKVMNIEDATITLLVPFSVLPKSLEVIYNKILEYQKKYQDRVKIITKPTEQSHIANLYKNCQVYIQPSKYESFGLCIIEAMATGRPVVAFKVGGIPQVIGDSGVVVNDKKSFLSKIEELIKNRELCQNIGERACARAKTFEWDTIAKKTINFYKVILNE